MLVDLAVFCVGCWSPQQKAMLGTIGRCTVLWLDLHWRGYEVMPCYNGIWLSSLSACWHSISCVCMLVHGVFGSFKRWHSMLVLPVVSLWSETATIVHKNNVNKGYNQRLSWRWLIGWDLLFLFFGEDVRSHLVGLLTWHFSKWLKHDCKYWWYVFFTKSVYGLVICIFVSQKKIEECTGTTSNTACTVHERLTWTEALRR